MSTVVIIGIDPKYLDLPADAVGIDETLTAESILDGLNRSIDALRVEGHDASLVLTDLGETAADTVASALGRTPADVVVVGAGIRIPAKNTALLERVVNAAITANPTARLAFNTAPDDSEVAARRWL